MEKDYKKLYEDAAEKVAIRFGSNVAQEIFSELYESEDEKIRKNLIDMVKTNYPCDDVSKYVSWLEKQGEKKSTIQYNYVKFREGDTVQKITGDKDIVTIAEVDIEAEEYKLTNTGFIPFKYEHLWHIVKQNPAWSKEDITNYSKVLFCLQTLTFPTDAERKELITWLKKQCEQSSADGECKTKREAELNPAWSDDDELRFKKAIYIFHQNGYFDVENWLKSLKDRVQPTWKPTEEQLSALYWVITNIQLEEEDEETLQALYKLLKKL